MRALSWDVRFATETVSRETVSRGLQRGPNREAEALPVLVALEIWRERLRGRRVVFSLARSTVAILGMESLRRRVSSRGRVSTHLVDLDVQAWYAKEQPSGPV